MSIFEADPEGFRSQNIDRPASHLVRELIQNSLDEEGVTFIDVTVKWHGPRRGTTVTVKDDAPAGVKNLASLFTIWMSTKEDNPTMRGRMGRGLKELVSVSDQTIIRTCSQDALVFKRIQGSGKWTRSQKPRLGRPDFGTEVVAFVHAWGQKAADEVVHFLRRVRAPESIELWVNGERMAPFQAAERYEMKLPTVVYELDGMERMARDRTRECMVECFPPPADEDAYCYEMGIPVEAIDSPVSIDVQQRVILRERRDTLTDSYRKQLLAQVLSRRISLLPDEALRDNTTLLAAASSEHLSWQARSRIAEVWTAGKPFASTPAARQAATAHHIEAVNLRALPEAIRSIVRWNSRDVMDVLKERKSEYCPELSPLTQDMTRLVKFWEWVAKGIGRPCHVGIRAGEPGCAADFDRDQRKLSLYAQAVGQRFLAKPAGARQLGLLVHELAHWQPREDEHSSEFKSDSEDVGGAVAAFLLENAEAARLVLKGD